MKKFILLTLLLFCVSIFGNTENNKDLQQLIKKYPDYEFDIKDCINKYYINAYKYEDKYGINGLLILNEVGLQEISLLEKNYPDLINSVLKNGNHKSIAIILKCWAPFIKLNVTNNNVNPKIKKWLEIIDNLTDSQKDILQRNPKALPLIAVAPDTICDYLSDKDEEAIIPFQYLDFSDNPKEQINLLIDKTKNAGVYFNDIAESKGMPGMILYFSHKSLFNKLIPKVGIDATFAIIQSNGDDLLELYNQKYHTSQIIAALLPYIKDDEILKSLVSSGYSIRTLVENGSDGAACLEEVGGTGCDLIYNHYNKNKKLRKAAIKVLTETKMAGVACLDNYKDNDKFISIIQKKYAIQAVLKIHRADQLAEWKAIFDANPTNNYKFSEKTLNFVAIWSGTGEGNIDTIYERDGETLNDEFSIVEVAPTYDILKVGSLLIKGQVPTCSEWAFAGIDAGCTAWDIVCLLAEAPTGGASTAGIVASNSVRVGLKTGGKTITKKISQKFTKKIMERIIRKAIGKGLKSTDEITQFSLKQLTKKLGRELTEQQIRQQTKIIQKKIPKIILKKTLIELIDPKKTKQSAKTLKKIMFNMDVWDIKKFCGKSLTKSGLTLARQTTKSALMNKGYDIAKGEIIGMGLSYLVIDNMDNAIDFLLRLEENEKN